MCQRGGGVQTTLGGHRTTLLATARELMDRNEAMVSETRAGIMEARPSDVHLVPGPHDGAADKDD